MKYRHVIALRDSDTYPRSFSCGSTYLMAYGVMTGFEEWGNRFYLSEKERFGCGDYLICALNADDAMRYFGVKEGDFL